jgi:hypothetical protein
MSGIGNYSSSGCRSGGCGCGCASAFCSWRHSKEILTRIRKTESNWLKGKWFAGFQGKKKTKSHGDNRQHSRQQPLCVYLNVQDTTKRIEENGRRHSGLGCTRRHVRPGFGYGKHNQQRIDETLDKSFM